MLDSVLYILIVVIVVALLLLQRQNFSFSTRRTTKGASILKRYTTDLTARARANELDPIVERDEEIRRVIQTLGRRVKNNVVLVGQAGVGKTAIAEGLAQAIVEGKVPKTLRDKKVLSLDLNALVAGTKYRGEFESRVVKLSDEIGSAGRQIILFIDEIHDLTEAGGAMGGLAAGDMLKPALARGDLQVVGATTPLEYEKFIKRDSALDRRLQPLLVREPTQEETRHILMAVREHYEEHHGVKITDEAIKACVALSGKYLSDRAYPDKAIDLMDEAASAVRLRELNHSSQGVLPAVARQDVVVVVEAQHESNELLA